MVAATPAASPPALLPCCPAALLHLLHLHPQHTPVAGRHPTHHAPTDTSRHAASDMPQRAPTRPCPWAAHRHTPSALTRHTRTRHEIDRRRACALGCESAPGQVRPGCMSRWKPPTGLIPADPGRCAMFHRPSLLLLAALARLLRRCRSAPTTPTTSHGRTSACSTSACPRVARQASDGGR
jgi:hypothetical protein